MMDFFITIGIITLAICLIAFYPLFKNSIQTHSQKRNTLNKAFYFDRLKEVERETEEGVIDDPEQTTLELQQSLLDDIPEQPDQAISSQKSLGKAWFFALLLCVAGISSAVYFNIGSWFTGTMLEKSYDKLGYFYERLKTEEEQPFTSEELNQFAMALRVELQKNPEDDKSWFMLGQIGMALENGQLALDSFTQAVRLAPQNLQYKESYARLLLFSADPTDKVRGEQIVKEIIRVDHTNTEALSLLAFAAFEREDYQMAAMTWEMMLKLLPEDDPRRETIQRSIQSALSMQKGSGKLETLSSTPSP